MTQPRSRVVKKRVLNLIWEAGGEDKECIVFCLLMCRRYHSTWTAFNGRYFKHKASTDLVESDLYTLRKITSEHIAKLIIDSIQPGEGHLLIDSLLTNLLLQRYHPKLTL